LSSTNLELPKIICNLHVNIYQESMIKYGL
jgi:hypothetical protein